ncbi:hypothetical protein JJE72_12230, partial [Sinomonas sp. JC656]|nr:hypothetical protein [Sinomonas cellulolyticus]
MEKTQQPLGFLLKTLDGLLEDRFNEALEQHRLSRRQWQLLNVLADTEATVSQLDEAIAPFLDGSSTLGVVAVFSMLSGLPCTR